MPTDPTPTIDDLEVQPAEGFSTTFVVRCAVLFPFALMLAGWMAMGVIMVITRTGLQASPGGEAQFIRVQTTGLLFLTIINWFCFSRTRMTPYRIEWGAFWPQYLSLQNIECVRGVYRLRLLFLVPLFYVMVVKPRTGRLRVIPGGTETLYKAFLQFQRRFPRPGSA